jgi:hypothetical protein
VGSWECARAVVRPHLKLVHRIDAAESRESVYTEVMSKHRGNWLAWRRRKSEALSLCDMDWRSL